MQIDFENPLDKPGEKTLNIIWQEQADFKSISLIRRPGIGDGSVRPSIGVRQGVQPVKHNHFHDSEFYRLAPETGVLTNPYGKRMIRVGEEFIVALLGSLEDEVGEAGAREIMYKCGFQWGMNDMKGFVPRMRAEFETDLRKARVDFLMETWWWPLNISGWGVWRYDFTQRDKGLLFVELEESVVASSVGDMGDVLCYFYAGLFAAVFSVLSKRPLGCVEMQCLGTGADFCKFVISDHERADAAAFWRKQGASARDILRKLRQL